MQKSSTSKSGAAEQDAAPDEKPTPSTDTEVTEDTMQLEEALARVTELEAENASLQETIVQQEEQLGKQTEEITSLQTQLEDLGGTQEELAALKKAKEAEETAGRTNVLEVFAKAQGLDVSEDSVRGYIDTLDYEALIGAAMDVAKEKEAGTKSASSRPMADIGVTDAYGGILRATSDRGGNM